ncbi:S1C family serine protease [Paenibacillus mesophilus]|uniref:S1C family serine protease n=1 Tax=Paenibacillus mesophilus TaxID=2582849 RepID=UPI0013054716|nr:serine protease [Paenibacillus mesophilus]
MKEREHNPGERNGREDNDKEYEAMREEETDTLRDDEADEEEERKFFERKERTRKRIRKGITIFLIVALVANGAAFWPMLYNLQAIRFLAISRELSKSEAISQYKQAVVTVSTEDGKGTGFLISPDGYIVTNHHVIDGKKNVFVRFSEGTSHEAEVVISEASRDLAVLKIALNGEKRTALPLEREPSWKPGTHVYVIGNPLFFDHIVNQGTVVGEIPVQGLDVPAMAIEAPIYKGNSGSPLLSEKGEVVAVVFATTEIEDSGETRKVGLAVPVKHLIPLLDKMAWGGPTK